MQYGDRMQQSKERQPFIWVNSFDEEDVHRFYKQFFALESDPSITVITIFIDSYGGSVNGLFAMRDLIKSSQKPVSTVCVGKAMSAGACLLAAGSKGARFMAPDAEIMIHEASSGFWGKNQEIQASSRQMDKMNRRLIKNLASDLDKSAEELEDQLHKVKNADWYLSAREAKKWGIVDFVEIPRLAYQDAALHLVSVKP